MTFSPLTIAALSLLFGVAAAFAVWVVRDVRRKPDNPLPMYREYQDERRGR